MVLVYRYRWTGTETFHRDGKQQLGLGDCQVRTGEGQTRHVYLVSVAYSLLMRSLQQSRLQDWARRTLTTIGEACRAVKAETLERVVDWIVEKLISGALVSSRNQGCPHLLMTSHQTEALCKSSGIRLFLDHPHRTVFRTRPTKSTRSSLCQTTTGGSLAKTWCLFRIS